MNSKAQKPGKRFAAAARKAVLLTVFALLGVRSLTVAALPGAALPGAALPGEEESAVRFCFVDLYADSESRALAAWQVELIATAEAGEVKIVGIEGGEHPAYGQPAYYDPAALMHHRVILAAFNTGNDLPTGRTRVARVHLQVPAHAQPHYEVKLEAAADRDGQRIDVTVHATQGEPS